MFGNKIIKHIILSIWIYVLLIASLNNELWKLKPIDYTNFIHKFIVKKKNEYLIVFKAIMLYFDW